MTKREKIMNSTLRSPSTTVDTERSERMEKGVNPSRKTHEGVARFGKGADCKSV